MFPSGQHPIYSYTEEDKLTVLKNVGIQENQLKKDAEAIQDWIKKQPHLAAAGIDPHAAEFHVITAKGSVERAKQKIDFYYKERARSTVEIPSRVNLLKDQLRPVWNTHVIAPAPNLYNGSRISFTKVFEWDTFKIEDIIVNMSMLADIRCSNDYSSGETWIIDYENGSLGHLMNLNFMALSRAYWIMREGLGMRILAIHVVNCGVATTIQIILNIFKQFLSKKVMDRIKFHETPESLREYLPKEYLLEDYGGDLPSYEVYRVKMEKIITDEKTKQFLLDACNTISDESKRSKTEYCEDYLPGNFKKLDLD